MKDKIIKFLAYNGKVSVICSSTKNLVEKARNIHDLTPTTTAVMGRVLTVASMMAVSNIKEGNDKLTIQINGRGPVGQIVVVANNSPEVKAYMQDTKVELPLKENGKIDVGRAVGVDGFLNILTQNSITSASYNGMVPLVSGEIAEDFAEYFLKSQQKPSAVALGVLVDKNGVKSSGGYIVTLMPDATDEIAEKLEASIMKAKTISKLLEENTSLEDIAKIITGDEDIEIIEDDIEPVYNCDCSKENFENGLISLGKDEIKNIIEEDGHADIECHFCHKKYMFTKDDLEKILESM